MANSAGGASILGVDPSEPRGDLFRASPRGAPRDSSFSAPRFADPPGAAADSAPPAELTLLVPLLIEVVFCERGERAIGGSFVSGCMTMRLGSRGSSYWSYKDFPEQPQLVVG